MFWGLTIEPGKHYSQTVEQSFHVSMAALDTREKSGITQLLVRHEKAEFLLCTLIYGDKHPFPCFQQQLNLNLSEGSEISFYSEGKGTIHLTGYLVTDSPVDISQELLEQAENLLMDEEEEEEEDDEEDEEDDETDSEEESSSSANLSLFQKLLNASDEDDEDSDGEEWTPDKAKKSKEKSAKKKKRKSQVEPVADEATFSTVKKKRKAAVEAQALSKNELAEADGDDDDDEIDGDFIPAAADGDDDDDDDDSNEDGDYGDDDDDDDDSEEDEEEDKPKSTKETKSQTKREAGSGQDAGVSTNGQKSEEKGGQPLKNAKGDNKENIQAQKKEKAVKRQPEAQKTTPAPKKVKLQSGTSIEDIKLGEGKVAKPGRKVFVYYKGVFANNHKEFDSKLSGKPFMFILGRGEVIKGWDEGVRGMKVGGKRRLTVPPSQGHPIWR
ncbi:46 kDa FK506-binding nuclear protein-like isoform X2 [Diadema setosum]|uniref:46 kDa FK506-binding nuclear protein-like isoform X2 n=1 Tax=Diadema setosum TaxID=31175 RepID=UPI003B3A1344